MVSVNYCGSTEDKNNDDLVVRNYRDTDFCDVARVLGCAFQDETFTSLVLGPRSTREQAAQEIFELQLKDRLARGGQVDVATISGDIVGACMWEPKVKQSPTIRGYLQQAAGYIRSTRWRVIQAIVGQANVAWATPKQPHWYLHAIGADPKANRPGIGSALLQALIDRVPESDSVYLESSNEATTRLYKRFGFEPCGEIALWPGYTIEQMWRSAK